MKMERREIAQGAIEYLLIIGAAVIIAVIVIALMMSLAGQGTQAAQDADVRDIYHDLKVNLKGYDIEVDLQDYSTHTFPLSDPSACPENQNFYDPVIVNMKIDGELIATHTVAEKLEEFSFKTNFKGDPNEQHIMEISFNDAWSGNPSICLNKEYTDKNIKILDIRITNANGKPIEVRVDPVWSSADPIPFQ